MPPAPAPSCDCALPVRERNDQAGEAGRAWSGGLGSKCWLSALLRLVRVPWLCGWGWWWWWWCFPECPTVCRPSQHALTFSNPSKPSSDMPSSCSSKSSCSGAGTSTKDLSGLYGLSGAFQRRYSIAGVPVRLLLEPPTDSWERFRCPRGVLFQDSPGPMLRALRWLCGLATRGGRRSWSVLSGVWGRMVLLPGDRTFGLLGLARRYLRAYRMVNFHLEKKKKRNENVHRARYRVFLL